MDFTKEEYLKDVKLIISVYASNLWRVMKINSDELLGNVDLELAFDSGPEAQAELSKLDSFFSTEFFNWFDYSFEYGINGRYLKDQDPGSVEDEDFIPFWESLVAAADFLTNNYDGKCDFQFARISHVLEKMRTRQIMNNVSWSEIPGHIYLTELANLADLDEKTIRNIASKKPEGFPKIVKSGTRSLVDKEEARAWLLRRGWKETVTVTKDQGLMEPIDGFKSISDLKSRVSRLLESQSMTDEDRAEVHGWLAEFEVSLNVNIKAIKIISKHSGNDAELWLEHILNFKRQLEHTKLRELLTQH